MASNQTWKTYSICLVEDASALWIKQKPCGASTEFQRFEDQFNGHFRKLANVDGFVSSTLPPVGDNVAVQIQSRWYRATVQEHISSNTAFVFLVDYGKSKRALMDSLLSIPVGKWNSVPAQACRIQLVDIVPMTLNYSLNDAELQLKHRETNSWDLAATKFVNELMEANLTCEFKHVCTLEDGTYGGQLFIEMSPLFAEGFKNKHKLNSSLSSLKRVSLSHILSECQFGKLIQHRPPVRKYDHKLMEQYLSESSNLSSPERLQEPTNMKGVSGSLSGSPDNRLSPSDVDTRRIHIGRGRLSLNSSSSICSDNYHTASPYGTGRRRTSVSSTPDKSSTKGNFNNNAETLSNGASPIALGVTPLNRSPQRNLEFGRGLSNRGTQQMTFPGAGGGKDPFNGDVHQRDNKCRRPSLGLGRGLILKATTNENSNALNQHDRIEPFSYSHMGSKDSEGDTCSANNLSKEIAVNRLDDSVNSSTRSDNHVQPGRSRRRISSQSYCRKLHSDDEDPEHFITSPKFPDPRRSLPSCYIASAVPDEDQSSDKAYPIMPTLDLSKISPTKSIACSHLNILCDRVYNSGQLAIAPNEVIRKESMKHSLNADVYDKVNASGNYVSPLQNFLWPAVLKKRSCFAIGYNSAAKALGYIVPCISSLLDTYKMLEKRLPREIGPMLVIVCSGWKNVKNVACHIEDLLSNSQLNVASGWGGLGAGRLEACKKDIAKGYHVLVTTLPVMLHFIRESCDPKSDYLPYISPGRLCTLVLDDVDLLLKKSLSSFNEVLAFWSGSPRDLHKIAPKQLLVVASEWCKELDALYQKLNPILRPNIIISAHLEAAIACRVETYIHYIQPDTNSFDTVVKLVRGKDKVVIFVASPKEAKLLQQLLESVAIPSITVATSFRWEVQKKVEEWHRVTTPTMIVCQEAIDQLLLHDLLNAKNIIHTNIPDSRLELGRRYSLILDHMGEVREENNVASSHILLNESQVRASPHMILLLTRLGKVPTDILIIAKEALGCHQKEIEYVGLCSRLKALGECLLVNCQWRHHVTEKDAPSNIPESGVIHFDILHVYTASRFAIRLIDWTPPSTSEPENHKLYYNCLFKTLQDYYLQPKNKVNLQSISEGMICATNYRSKWVRAKVMNVDFSEQLQSVTLFLMDEGIEITRNGLGTLYVLSDAFKSMPQLALEAFLCDVSPLDFDLDWTDAANEHIKFLTTKETCGSDFFFEANITLALGKTLWLKPARKYSKLFDIFIVKNSLRSELLSCKFGVDNPSHLQNLKQLCKDIVNVCPSIPPSLSDHFEACMSIIGSVTSPELEACDLSESIPSLQSIIPRVSNRLPDSNGERPVSQNRDMSNSEGSTQSIIPRVSNGERPLSHNRNMSDSDGNTPSYPSQSPTNDASPSHSSTSVALTSSIKDSYPQSSYSNSNFDRCYEDDQSTTDSRASSLTAHPIYTVEQLELYVKIPVKVGEIESPSHFYVSKNRNSKRLESLIKELKGHHSKGIQKPHSYSRGDLALAVWDKNQLEDDSWIRVRIEAVQGNQCEVFSLDFGNTLILSTEKLYHYPRNKVKDLPAQAILCELAHVRVPCQLVLDAAEAMDEIKKKFAIWSIKPIERKESIHGTIYVVEMEDPLADPPLVMWRELSKRGVIVEDCPSSLVEESRIIKSETTVPKKLKAATPIAALPYLIPTTRWFQDHYRIHLAINLNITNDFDVKFSSNHLVFNATVTNVDYAIDVDLYAFINAEESSASESNRMVNITLIKKMPGMWPRLLQKKDLIDWLRYVNSDDCYFYPEASQCDYDSEAGFSSRGLSVKRHSGGPPPSLSAGDGSSDDEMSRQSSDLFDLD